MSVGMIGTSITLGKRSSVAMCIAGTNEYMEMAPDKLNLQVDHVVISVEAQDRR